MVSCKALVGVLKKSRAPATYSSKCKRRETGFYWHLPAWYSILRSHPSPKMVCYGHYFISLDGLEEEVSTFPESITHGLGGNAAIPRLYS